MAQLSNSSQEIGFCHTLRVWAAFAIVFAHVAGGSANGQAPLSGAWWLCKILYMSCLWAVPLFVMISGMLLLNHQESSATFYRRRFKRIGIPLVFWSTLYLGLHYWRNPGPLVGLEVADALLSGKPYAHLWFLYMIAGLYLLTPFLRTFIRTTAQPQRLALIIAGLVLGDAYYLTNMMFWGNSSSVFTLFLPFISYYLLGYELTLTPLRLHFKGMVIAAVAIIAYVGTLGSAFIELEGQHYGLFFFSFFCPPAVLSAIVIFMMARHWEPRLPSWLKRCHAALAPTTLGIYVIHIAILEALAKAGGNDPGEGNLSLALMAGPIVAFSLSAGVTAIMLKIPLLRRTVG